MMITLVLLAAGMPACPSAALGADRLPQELAVSAAAPAQGGKRGWTIRDIVEVREIVGVALSEERREAAFIVKQPTLQDADIRYGLYVVALDGSAPARKLVEAAYLADPAGHPGTDLWTVRAQFDAGVQLYDVDKQGAVQPLVVNPDTAKVGGTDSPITSAHEQSRQTGVLSYGWAPDGSALWYSRLRLEPPARRQAMYDRGTVYDSETMFSFAFHTDRTVLAGTELRLFVPATRADRELTFVSSSALDDIGGVFDRHSTSWTPDSRHIQYYHAAAKPDGGREFPRWDIEVTSGKVQRMPDGEGSALERIYAVPMPRGQGYLTTRTVGDERHLVQIGADGKLVSDHGALDGSTGGSQGFWWDASGRRAILGARYRDRDGLIAFPQSKSGAALAAIGDSLNHCDFTADLSVGVCVRQSLTLAPELVAVSTADGRLKTLAHPNTRFDAVEPLRSEHLVWTNRYGSHSEGYITYPRGYVQGRKYPALLVTHGSDARNLFAYYGFQWEMPVQVFAESGYVVLSVNDPRTDSKTSAAGEAFLTGSTDVDVAGMQFYKNLNPLAGMEAALQSVVDRGMVDPQKTGIAGYSRGTEVVEFALAHSKMFKAGADGDAGGWNPSVYWFSGTTRYQALFRGMYGGSLYDPKALPNYQKYAPAFRASEFAGPFLQQFTAVAGPWGLELHTLLKDAGIPAELVFYQDETHIFWHPRHRAAAMERYLDWFNYWLLDQRDPAPAKQEQYRRWDAMAAKWKRRS